MASYLILRSSNNGTNEPQEFILDLASGNGRPLWIIEELGTIEDVDPFIQDCIVHTLETARFPGGIYQ